MPPNSEPTLHIVDALPSELTTTKTQEQGGALITTVNTTNKTDDAKHVSSSTVVTRHNMLRPLHCEAQQYAWGRLGSSSTVARMKEAQAVQVQEDDDDFYLEETKPYAELWLGTHPAGMSRVTMHAELEHAGSSTMSLDGSGSSITDDDDAASNESPVTNSSSSCSLAASSSFGSSSSSSTTTTFGSKKCSLADYVKANPDLHCGSNSEDLSFLLKILSVRKVLSIQAHPDKHLAEQLHAERPHIYKDPNHKPEMAIALSDKVRAMCGFRPLGEIAAHLQSYPEFRTLVGETMARRIEEQAADEQDQQAVDAKPLSSSSSKEVLATMFQNYLLVKPDIMIFLVDRMTTRLRTKQHDHNAVEKLILQLQEQFPGDCGIFAPLMFNIVELNRGQGLFIAANEPHAYLSGEIIECMACSDNVVRAGLTPKLKDVDTLVGMLTYKCGMPAITDGEQIDECLVRYCPPICDFCMEVITVPAGQTYDLQEVGESPSILLTLEGEASLRQEAVCSLDVSFGSAVFLSAQTGCTIQAGPYGVRLTRAFTNVYHQDT